VRLACGDHSFPLLEHDQVCDLVAALGFDGIDIAVMGNRSHIRPEVVRDDVAGWAGRIAERLERRGLAVADVFLIPWTDLEVMTPNHPDEAERLRSRELFVAMLELARRIGSPGITQLPGLEFEGHAHADSLGRAARELSARVALAADAGLALSIEPHVGSVAERPADTLELLERTPGLTLALDHTHYVRQGIAVEETDALLPYARHYHARCARPGRLQTRMADNTIDFERVVGGLREHGYDGYLAVEYVWTEWERCNECDNVSETVLLRDRLRAALAGEPWTYEPSAA
jgi:sugar phosphate isomerase/epimerase